MWTDSLSHSRKLYYGKILTEVCFLPKVRKHTSVSPTKACFHPNDRKLTSVKKHLATSGGGDPFHLG
jgi:hypothetical protein